MGHAVMTSGSHAPTKQVFAGGVRRIFLHTEWQILQILPPVVVYSY